MKVIALVENLSILPEIRSKHGLSLYIETEKHKILFDVGSDDLFLENAKKLGIDIKTIDTVVISHGHRDHGGALELLLEKNPSAKIYIQEAAFEGHYTKFLGLRHNIGIDSSLKKRSQIVLTGDVLVIDEELTLFSNVTERALYSCSNDTLYEKTENGTVKDSFRHEQNLIIRENGQSILFAGCAHNGIVNIKKKGETLNGKKFDRIVSGFHLYNPITKKTEKDAFVESLALEMKKGTSKYYTCHCTGEKAYETMKGILGDQIEYIKAGSMWVFN